MRYSYKGLKKYLEGNYSSDELKKFLEKLGLNPLEIKSPYSNEFELEIPSNRPDLMCAVGIAKSLLPFGDFKFHFPNFQITNHTEKKFPVEILSTEDCYCYAGRCIENVKVSSSPDWLKQQVESAGFRSVNNIVDITNLVFWELGQPMHAFNKDLLDAKIIVRRAIDGEQITTLDGIKRTLNNKILVIADEHKPVAIAGIMGAINSEVDEKTDNLFIESAFFNPVLIRKSSKILGLRTEASSKFEKGIDPEMLVIALDRCCGLITDEFGGQIGALVLNGGFNKNKKNVSLNVSKLRNYLGYNIPVDFVKEVFNKLGFQFEFNGDIINVSVSSDRQDIAQDVDLIEEIAKYWGYEKIPEEIPSVAITPSQDDSTYLYLDKIKKTITQLGFSEVINLGLISKDEINYFEEINKRPLEILNPVSMNFSFLRTSLIIELLKNFQYNSAYKNENISLFEIGNKYFSSDNDAPSENMSLSLGSMDKWDFSVFKGKMEYFLKTYFFPELDYGIYLKRDEKNTGIYYNIILENESKKIILGFIFQPSFELLEKYDLQGREILLAQIDLDVLKNKGFSKNFFDKNKIPSIPSIRRDLSLVVKAGPHSEWKYIVQSLHNFSPRILYPKDKIEVFDIYYFSAQEKEYLLKNLGFEKRTDIVGVGISIFFSNEKGELTKDDIDKKVHEIVEVLKKQEIRLRYQYE